MLDLFSCDQCLPVAVTRAGRAMVPKDDTELEAGDVVNLSSTLEGIQELGQRIGRLPQKTAKGPEEG